MDIAITIQCETPGDTLSRISPFIVCLLWSDCQDDSNKDRTYRRRKTRLLLDCVCQVHCRAERIACSWMKNGRDLLRVVCKIYVPFPVISAWKDRHIVDMTRGAVHNLSASIHEATLGTVARVTGLSRVLESCSLSYYLSHVQRNTVRKMNNRPIATCAYLARENLDVTWNPGSKSRDREKERVERAREERSSPPSLSDSRAGRQELRPREKGLSEGEGEKVCRAGCAFRGRETHGLPNRVYESQLCNI